MPAVLLAAVLWIAGAAPARASALERVQKRFEGWVASTVQPLFDEIKSAVRGLTEAGPEPGKEKAADPDRPQLPLTPDDIKDSKAASAFNERHARPVAAELSNKDVLPYMNVTGPKPQASAPAAKKKKLEPAKWRGGSIEPTKIQSLRDSQ